MNRQTTEGSAVTGSGCFEGRRGFRLGRVLNWQSFAGWSCVVGLAACANPGLEDAGARDFGAVDDAGVVDARSDMGPQDALLADAGPADADPLDADLVDVGGQDAGPDASTSDSGIDAGDVGPLPAVGRTSHSATLLLDGRVLIAGGRRANAGGPAELLASAAVFDPATGTFAPTGMMTVARFFHTATRLTDGRVLITGGTLPTDARDSLATSEIFDPATNTFTASSDMQLARRSHSAILVSTGEVLIFGGSNRTVGASGSAELYSPTTGQFRFAAQVPLGTNLPHLVETAGGQILLAGGHRGRPYNDAYLYDPATEQFTQTGSMMIGRVNSVAVPFPDGRVLIAGGSQINVPTDTVEIYDPVTGTFSAAGEFSNSGTSYRTATLIDNDRFLLAGGTDAATLAFGLYQISTATLADSAAKPSFSLRGGHTATLLDDGRVLFAGGYDPAFNTWTYADIYDPATDSISPTGALPSN